jgi:hypothetical protein
MAKDAKAGTVHPVVREDVPPLPPLTDEQINQIDLLLQNGGGVTYGDIKGAIDYGSPKGRIRIMQPGEIDHLDAYLLKQIALGNARRVWNKDAEDHFYMAVK